MNIKEGPSVNRNMFCPKCGKADQQPETFCRQCGNYLLDYDKPAKRRHTPEDHIKANTVLNLLTAITSLVLAILLYSVFLGKQDTPVLIYVTAGFLTAMFFWQVQTFWRTILLKKHFKKKKIEGVNRTENPIKVPNLEAPEIKELLNEADFSNNVSASVIENTTRKLKVRNSK